MKEIRIRSVKKIIRLTLNSKMHPAMKKAYASTLVKIINNYDEVNWYYPEPYGNYYINLISLFHWGSNFDYWSNLHDILYKE